jgi:hypothetical protein
MHEILKEQCDTEHIKMEMEAGTHMKKPQKFRYCRATQCLKTTALCYE